MVQPTLNDFTKRKQLQSTQRNYLLDRPRRVQRWLDRNLSLEDHADFVAQMLQSPFLASLILEQDKMGNRQKIQEIVQLMATDSGRMDLIVGGKGSGKTTLAHYIAYYVHHHFGVDIYWYGPPAELPDYITPVLSFSEIPENSLIIIDEASVQFSSRAGQGIGDQQDMINKLPTLRHGGHNMLVITQSTSLMDVNFLRLADGIFWKSYQLFGDQTERDAITISDDLKVFMPPDNDPPKECLYYYDDGIYSFQHGLPPNWDEGYSTPYDKISEEGKQYRYALKLMQYFDDDHVVQEQLQQRSVDLDRVQLMYLRLLLKDHDLDELLALDNDALAQLCGEGFSDAPLQDHVRGTVNPDQDYNFKLKPVQEEMRKRMEQGNQEFQVYSDRNANKLILKDLRERLDTGNLIISIYGEQDSGKSWQALAMAELLLELFPDTDPSDWEDRIHIFYSKQEILDNLEDMEAGDVVIMDEQPDESGTGSERREGQLQTVEETLRQEQIHFLFVAPSPKTHTDYWRLKAFGIDEDQEVSKALAYTNNRELLGYVTLSRPSPELVDHYNQLKDAFTERVKAGDFGGGAEYEDKARQLLNRGAFTQCDTKSKLLTVIDKEYNVNKEEAKRIRDEVEMLYADSDEDFQGMTSIPVLEP